MPHVCVLLIFGDHFSDWNDPILEEIADLRKVLIQEYSNLGAIFESYFSGDN